MENTDFIEVYGAREHNLKDINVKFHVTNWSLLQGFPVVENHHWLLIQYLQRVKEDISKLFQPMPDSFRWIRAS